jgi:hypothetical protein
MSIQANNLRDAIEQAQKNVNPENIIESPAVIAINDIREEINKD